MDKDIESFFLNRAVEFESLSKARTYLVCDADQLKNGTKPLKIYAYFSLALKVLSVPDETSNRIRKDLDGYNAKIHGSPIRDFPCYLIGQLSKNYNINQNPLSGKDLLQFAYDIIATSVSAVGGRYIMIECKNNDKLLHFYAANHFFKIAEIPDGENPMVQMLRRID